MAGTGVMTPEYLIYGGCVFVPLTHVWLAEAAKEPGWLPAQLEKFRWYLQEQRRGDQQVIVLLHVLVDEVNAGYHNLARLSCRW